MKSDVDNVAVRTRGGFPDSAGALEPRLPSITQGMSRSRLAQRAGLLIQPDVLALMLFAAALGSAVMWAMQDAIVDDGYITLDYARTLAFHHEWGLLPGVPANTATSPLNVMILGALTAVVRNPMTALWIISIVNPVVMAGGLSRLGARWGVGSRLAWIATPMLVLNPLLASSLGLETTLTVTAIVWLLERAAAGDARAFGWLTGVALVLRPDFALIVAIIWLGHPELRVAGAQLRGSLTSLAAIAWRAAVVALPWYVFSWIYFGSAIPDTLVIKHGQTWGSYATGVFTRLHRIFPTTTDAMLVVAAIGLIVLAATPLLAKLYPRVARRVAVAGIVGLGYFGAYVALGVPPYSWYYGIPMASLTIVAAWGIAAYSRSYTRLPRAEVSRAVCALLAFAVMSPILVTWATSLDARSPLRQAPIQGNWALSSKYKQIGLALRHLPPGTSIRSAGEFGALLYYCDCNLVDKFDNRALVMDELVRARDASPLLGLNYLFLDPSDYPPVREDYHLVWSQGHSNEPGTFNTWSPTKGRGHYSIQPGAKPTDLGHGAYDGQAL